MSSNSGESDNEFPTMTEATTSNFTSSTNYQSTTQSTDQGAQNLQQSSLFDDTGVMTSRPIGNISPEQLAQFAEAMSDPRVLQANLDYLESQNKAREQRESPRKLQRQNAVIEDEEEERGENSNFKNKGISRQDVYEIFSWPRPISTPIRDESYEERMKRMSKNFLWEKFRKENFTQTDLKKYCDQRFGVLPNPFTAPQFQGPPRVMRTIIPLDTNSVFDPVTGKWIIPQRMKLQAQTSTNLKYGSQINQFLQPALGAIQKQPQMAQASQASQNEQARIEARSQKLLEEIADTPYKAQLLKEDALQRIQEAYPNIQTYKDQARAIEEGLPLLRDSRKITMDEMKIMADQEANMIAEEGQNKPFITMIDERINNWENMARGVRSLADNLNIRLSPANKDSQKQSSFMEDKEPQQTSSQSSNPSSISGISKIPPLTGKEESRKNHIDWVADNFESISANQEPLQSSMKNLKRQRDQSQEVHFKKQRQDEDDIPQFDGQSDDEVAHMHRSIFRGMNTQPPENQIPFDLRFHPHGEGAHESDKRNQEQFAYRQQQDQEQRYQTVGQPHYPIKGSPRRSGGSYGYQNQQQYQGNRFQTIGQRQQGRNSPPPRPKSQQQKRTYEKDDSPHRRSFTPAPPKVNVEQPPHPPFNPNMQPTFNFGAQQNAHMQFGFQGGQSHYVTQQRAQAQLQGAQAQFGTQQRAQAQFQSPQFGTQNNFGGQQPQFAMPQPEQQNMWRPQQQSYANVTAGIQQPRFVNPNQFQQQNYNAPRQQTPWQRTHKEMGEHFQDYQTQQFEKENEALFRNLDNLHRGQKPRLSDAQIREIEAMLEPAARGATGRETLAEKLRRMYRNDYMIPRSLDFWINQPPPDSSELNPITFGGLHFSRLPLNDYGTYTVGPYSFLGPMVTPIRAEQMPMEDIIKWVEELTPSVHDPEILIEAKSRVMMGLIQNEKAKREHRLTDHPKAYEQIMTDHRIKTLEAELAYQKALNNKTPQMTMKSNHEEQFQMISDKASTDKTAADTHQIMLQMMQRMAMDKPNDPVLQEMLLNASLSIQSQQQKATAKEMELASTKQLAERYENKLKRPITSDKQEYTIETIKKLEPHNILKAIKPFDPDKNPDTIDFSNTWTYVLSYTKSLSPLTEASYIDILLLVLQGQAHRIVFDMSCNRASLEDILETLSNLYCIKKTILDDMKDLNTFKRKANESIMRTMSRAKLIVQKLQHLYQPNSWKESSDRILMSLLKQVISKKTRIYIEIEEKKKLKLGLFIDYKSCLDMVDTFETTHDEVPKGEIVTTVNACSGVPVNLDSNFTSENDDLNERVSKMESFFAQNNAFDPNDRRSAKERTKSASRDRMKQRDKPVKKSYIKQMEQYKKVNDEEKMEVDRQKKQKAITFEKNSNHQSGYDRKRITKDNRDKDKRENKKYDKYTPKSSSSNDRSRPRERSNRSYNKERSYSNNRSSGSRPASGASNYSTQSRNSSRNSYRESSRSQSRNNRSSSRNSYQSRDNSRNSRSGRSRERDQKRSPNNKNLNRDFSRENFNRKSGSSNNSSIPAKQAVVNNYYYKFEPNYPGYIPGVSVAHPQMSNMLTHDLN